jgi:hypothetical protein
MGIDEKGTASGATATSESPLADVFPGRTIALSDGTIVTVRKWTARDVIHEVPAILGRMMVKVQGVVRTFGQDAEDVLPALLKDSAGEITDLLAFTVRLEPEYLEGLGADEYLMLVRAMIEENLAFFGQVAKFYQLLRRELPGT